MIKLENEHYIRFILLLIKGGTEILRKTVIKGLEKQNISLNVFLQTNKAAICNSKQISQLQRDILYPPSPHFSDIAKWDISLLSYIALDFLSNVLSGTEKIAVKKIRDMRNNVHAHSDDAAIETRKFTFIWSELSLMITTLSHTMTEEERHELVDLIATLSGDQLDIYKAIEELKLLERRDEFFECIQTSLEYLQRSQAEIALAVDSCHKDVLQIKNTVSQDLSDIKKQLFDLTMKIGENTKVVNTMFGKVRVSADEQIIVTTAENVLLSASVESVRKAEPSDTLTAVVKKVDTFVEDVEGLGVKVDSVDEGSIVFTFTCSSLGSVIDIIDYFQSPLIQRRLDDIAVALESVICQKVHLTASIVLEPLQAILKKFQAMDHKRTLKFSMTCTGVEGLQHAWNVFEEGAASNSLNDLSKALTEAVGKPVQLETSIDLEQMKKAIQSTKEQLESYENQMTEQMGGVQLNDTETFTSVNEGPQSNESEVINKEASTLESGNDVNEAKERVVGENCRRVESEINKQNHMETEEDIHKSLNVEKDIEAEGNKNRNEIKESEQENQDIAPGTSKEDVSGTSKLNSSTYTHQKVFGSGKEAGIKEEDKKLEMPAPLGGKWFEIESSKSSTHSNVHVNSSGTSKTVAALNLTTAVDNGKPVDINTKKETKGTAAENRTGKKHEIGYDVDTGFQVKTDSEPKESVNKTQDSSGNKAQARKESWVPESEPSIMVHFHVLIHSDVKINPDVDIVVVRIGDDRFGGWNDDRHKMEVVRKYATGYIRMTYCLSVPTSRITKKKRLKYKYFVIRNTKTSKGHDRKNLWDHYYIKGSTGPKYNRRLMIPDKTLAESSFSGTWHQYDGVVNRRPKEGVISWLKDKWSRKQKFQDDAELSAEKFGEDLLDRVNCKNASPHDICKAAEKIESLIIGIRRTYLEDAQCYSTEDEMDSVLGKYLFCPVYTCFEQHNIETDRTEKWWQRRMALLFSVLAVMKSLNCICVDEDTGHNLCRALLIIHEPGIRESREMNFLLKQFPNRRAFYTDALVQLVKRIAQNSKDPSWLYAMPLVHFFSGVGTPFGKMEDVTKHDADIPVWWGISDIGRDTVDAFKGFKAEKWVIPLQEVIEILAPLFEADYLLPRTIMSSLNLVEVYDAVSSNSIPIEICCATLVYFIKVTRPKYWYGSKASKAENFVYTCIKTVFENLKQSKYDSSQRVCKTNWKLATSISLDLAKEALVIDSNRNLTASCSVLVFLMCVSQHNESAEQKKSNSTEKETMNDIRILSGIAVRWLEKQYTYFYTYLEISLNVWNSFMVPEELLSKEVETFWNGAIATALDRKLTAYIGNYQTNTDTFVKLYCQKAENFNSSMQKCLHATAYKAMERAYNIEVGTFNDRERAKFGILLSRLFDAEWSKMMKDVSDIHDRAFLMKLFQWSPFLHFMNIFFTKQYWDLLNDDCKMKLMTTISIIDTRVDELLKGSIIVGDLLLVHRFEETFTEAATLVKQGDRERQVSKEMIVKALHVRKKELDEFLSNVKLMVSLTYLCKKLTKVDISDIDEVLQKQADIEIHKLNEFCRPTATENVDSIDSFVPVISAFELTDQIKTALPQMSRYQMSALFMKMWDSQCDQNVENCTSFQDVLGIWQPVEQSWQEISQTIQEGTMHFSEFERLIGRMFGTDYEMIESELKILEVTEAMIRIRIDQLKKYRHLETCKMGAVALLRFKKKYDLKGDFKEIQIIAGDETSQLAMSEFDDSFIDACKFLESFTQTRAKCLETFLNCQPLVEWLKESMHTSGLKELQVFVDLALMSIGDDPYNIGKVQALHSAVTGYAPLIFDLQKDCGFRSLLELCKIVWQNLEANSKLPKQLEDTGSQLEWLKEIKNAHGSVEVTSMMQTEAINSDGTYTVGRPAAGTGKKSKYLDDNILAVEDTIKLTVPEERGKRQLREYTFAQLQDLQSRLMLVAGKAEKGTDSVERFTMVCT